MERKADLVEKNLLLVYIVQARMGRFNFLKRNL